ncbi:MAG: hypothetical protein II695_01775, partial [Oscillospiraceae bacterium]|nr:hypothetical protein [Oscillospiraceae bacterium]
ALVRAGRRDLIGHGEGKLVPPDAQYTRELNEQKNKARNAKGNGKASNSIKGGRHGAPRGPREQARPQKTRRGKH